MENRQRGAAWQRVVAIGAGMLLVGSAFTGVAFAAEEPDPTPDNPLSSVTDELNGSGSGTEEGSEDNSGGLLTGLDVENPDADTDGTADTGSETGTETDDTDTDTDTGNAQCQALAAQLANLQAQLARVNGLLADNPLGALLTSLQEQAVSLNQQIADVRDQIAAAVCSAIPDTGTGTGTDTGGSGFITEYPSPEIYGGYSDLGDGHRLYGDCGCTTASTVAPGTVSQVSSVPQGGVATGDGSYGP